MHKQKAGEQITQSQTQLRDETFIFFFFKNILILKQKQPKTITVLHTVHIVTYSVAEPGLEPVEPKLF